VKIKAHEILKNNEINNESKICPVHKHHAMKIYGTVGGKLHTFLT
jgi:hypothetical protein